MKKPKVNDDKPDITPEPIEEDAVKKQGKDYKVGKGKPPIEYRFKEGQSGNPKGAQKGSLSITAAVKRELQNIPDEFKNKKDKKTFFDLLIMRILSKAIKNGDTRMINQIWAYIDGSPKQTIQHEGGFEETLKGLALTRAEEYKAYKKQDKDDE